MRACEVALNVDSREDPIELVFVGDVHIGNGQCDEELVKQVVKRLQRPNTYWIDLGDACDFIQMRDKRFDLRELPPWLEGIESLTDVAGAEIERFKMYFEPVRHNCLARLHGNHEETIRIKGERDVYGELNRWFGLPKQRILGMSGFIRLRLQRQGKTAWTLRVFVHHGNGGGKLSGAPALNLERLSMAFDADIFAMGHTHHKMFIDKRRVGMDSRRLGIYEQPLILINTGAFTRGEQGGYAERSMMYPQGLGPIEVWFWPQSGKQGLHEWRVIA